MTNGSQGFTLFQEVLGKGNCFLIQSQGIRVQHPSRQNQHIVIFGVGIRKVLINREFNTPMVMEKETIIRLARVGFSNVKGYVDGGFEA